MGGGEAVQFNIFNQICPRWVTKVNAASPNLCDCTGSSYKTQVGSFLGISISDSASTNYEKVYSKMVIFPLSRTTPVAFLLTSEWCKSFYKTQLLLVCASMKISTKQFSLDTTDLPCYCSVNYCTLPSAFIEDMM